MRLFSAGAGWIQTLTYSPDCRFLITDLRGQPTQHSWMGFTCQPARELVWWDWLAGTAWRRFQLKDSLFGPGGAIEEENRHGAEASDSTALDVSFCLDPWRVATAWEWTNKEDGVCVY